MSRKGKTRKCKRCEEEFTREKIENYCEKCRKEKAKLRAITNWKNSKYEKNKWKNKIHKTKKQQETINIEEENKPKTQENKQETTLQYEQETKTIEVQEIPKLIKEIKYEEKKGNNIQKALEIRGII